jgi:hypothetical protein
MGADDHKSKNSKTNSKYFQLKWCPLGLTWQKLQHARYHVKNIDLIENPIDLLLIYR